MDSIPASDSFMLSSCIAASKSASNTSASLSDCVEPVLFPEYEVSKKSSSPRPIPSFMADSKSCCSFLSLTSAWHSVAKSSSHIAPSSKEYNSVDSSAYTSAACTGTSSIPIKEIISKYSVAFFMILSFLSLLLLHIFRFINWIIVFFQIFNTNNNSSMSFS